MTDHDTLAAALVAALTKLATVEKGRNAKIESKTGRNYTYDYADLADVVKLTRPVLAEEGIVALTPVHGHERGLACTVELVHTSGETKVFDPLPFPDGRDAQSTGSAITYHRRYALLAALGMAPDDDDDGATATASARAEQAPISDNDRRDVHQAIDALSEAAKELLRGEWKQRKIRKLEELTAADLDQVHALIVEVEAMALQSDLDAIDQEAETHRAGDR